MFGFSIEYACGLFGLTKQAYYKRKHDEEDEVRRHVRLLDAVEEIRKMDPGIGYYKLWLMMKRMFIDD